MNYVSQTSVRSCELYCPCNHYLLAADAEHKVCLVYCEARFTVKLGFHEDVLKTPCSLIFARPDECGSVQTVYA